MNAVQQRSHVAWSGGALGRAPKPPIPGAGPEISPENPTHPGQDSGLSSAWPLLALLAVSLLPGAARAEAPDPLRLSTEIVPTRERLELVLDARLNDYSGVATIELKANQPTSALKFHAKALELTKLRLTNDQGEIPITFKEEAGDLVNVTPAHPLAKGAYQLEIQFHNDYNTRAISLYKVETGGNAYLFSQFEAMFAREAFPCWDEPGFKIPWDVVMTVPRADEAVTNMPVEKEEVKADGWKRVTFQATPPMSSYLLAFAAGPLEMTPIPGLSIPGRVVTVKGQRPYAAEAVKATPALLKGLEQWFDSRYPYPKLDLIATPEFMYGAMENPGAIVFKDSVLLMDSAQATIEDRAGLFSITTHELAHSWFGDLVTMEWWNDLWLNESFASWMATKIVAQVHPELRVEVHAIHTPQNAMNQDSRLSTKAIRREVPAQGDALHNIGLHYSKGESILAMFERWLGPETFRQGVLTHLKTHAWGNATAQELFAAFEKAGGKAVIEPMSTFLNQPGVPVVVLDKLQGTALTLRQQRVLPPKSKAQPQLWQIPLRIRYDDGTTVKTQTVLMTKEIQTIRLEGKKAPTWVHLNDGEQGYYRWQVPAAVSTALLADATRMSQREKLGYLGNAQALVQAGLQTSDQYLPMLETFSREQDPAILNTVVYQLTELWGSFVRGDAAQEALFRARLGKLLSPILARLGMQEVPGEALETTTLRANVFYHLGHIAHDKAVLAEAQKMTARWLANPTSLSASLVEPATGLAAQEGNAELFDTFQKRFETAETAQDRNMLLAGMGLFEDPALEKRAREYVLTGPLRPHEVATILFEQSGRDPAQTNMLAFLTSQYDKITAPISSEFTVFMPFLAVTCSQAQFSQVQPFFTQKAQKEPGMADFLQQVQEEVNTCAQLRAQEGPAVKRWLQASN